MGKHIFYLDNLRTFAVFLSILCLAAASFTIRPLVPPYIVYDGTPGFDRLLSYSFNAFSMALVVPVLFFLSGYFSAYNLRIRLFQPYFHGRWLGLGWPALFASIVFMPGIAWISARSLGLKLSFIDFLTSRFLGSGFTLGIYGFLFILLIFTGLVMLAKKMNRKALQHTAGGTPSILFLCAFVVIHLAIVTLLLFILYLQTPGGARSLDSWHWFWNMLGLQPRWFVSAFMYFLLGIYASKHRWFMNGGYVPGRIWMILGLASCIIYTLLTPFLLLQTIVSVFFSFAGTLGLIAAFARWCDVSSKTSLTLAKAAYPIWFLSAPVLETVYYFLQPLAAAAPLKLLLALMVTLVYNYVVYKYALCHLACFKTR